MTESVLLRAVDAAFGADGPLAREDWRYQARPGQLAMAHAVAQTMEEGGALVVEAGTGVGKTYAYLIPALLSGERVLVSTATKALQDQLFARDIPALLQVLGLPRKLALLKGRSSYLCQHRLALARHALPSGALGAERALAKVEQWAQATVHGDLAELPGLDEQSPVIPWVTSTRENCLGSACDHFRACHLNRARREALAADMVVINHHLFFADLQVRESGMAELLPSVRVVVFDEAHQLNEIGVQFLGLQLTGGQLEDYARDVAAAGLQAARGFADWPAIAQDMTQAVAAWQTLVQGHVPGARWPWVGDVPDGMEATSWNHGLCQLSVACAGLVQALDATATGHPALERLRERGNQLLMRLAHFSAPPPEGRVRWVEAGRSVRLQEAPLSIALDMQERVLKQPVSQDAEDEWPVPEDGPGRAWIFTSATLGDDAQLRWFTQPCGLENARVLQVASPFDYARQAAWHVPAHLPLPAAPGHSESLATWLGPHIRHLQGRTLVLTTTLRALRVMGDRLRGLLPGLEVLVQGEGSKKALLERFREGQQHGRSGCVLVASASFWEGVDVPGEALQMVVIDKLPFPPPDDPLVQARVQAIAAAGGKPFTQYAVPEAAVALKQGAGRLIRHETDRGLLVIGDVRLLTQGYGKRLLRALPPMRQAPTEEAMEAEVEALAQITRTSTTDLPWL